MYNSQTVPAGTLTPYIPALLEHTVSVGYGTYVGNYRVDFAYQVGVGPETNVDRSNIIGGDFDFSRIDTAAHWASVSFSR